MDNGFGPHGSSAVQVTYRTLHLFSLRI